MAHITPAKGKAAAAPSDGWVFRVGGRTVTDETGYKRLVRGDTGVPTEELGLVEFDEGAVTGPGAWPAFTWDSLVANDAVETLADRKARLKAEADDEAAAMVEAITGQAGASFDDGLDDDDDDDDDDIDPSEDRPDDFPPHRMEA